VDILAVHEAR